MRTLSTSTKIFIAVLITFMSLSVIANTEVKCKQYDEHGECISYSDSSNDSSSETIDTSKDETDEGETKINETELDDETSGDVSIYEE